MTTMIPFTQYLRPDGRKRATEIPMPDDVGIKAQEIIKQGFRFECEELNTGMAVFYVFDPEIDENAAIEMCPNGPAVPKTVKAMIMSFDMEEAQTRRLEVRTGVEFTVDVGSRKGK